MLKITNKRQVHRQDFKSSRFDTFIV